MDMIYKQFINGQWVEASHTWEVLNPATEEVVQTVPFGGAEDCQTAIEAAAAAFPVWGMRQTPYQRADILKKAADLIRTRLDTLAPITVSESGKPLAEARGEWNVTADLLEWYAEEGKRAYGRVIPSRHPTKRRMVIKQPMGVVGVITAWNFPIYNPGRAVAAALAAGCTVVLRPSEYTPLTAMLLVSILTEAGLPAGVLNLINGDAHAMGQAMLDHPQLRKISFTGSTRVGRILMEGAGRTFTRLGLELGGNAPVLVFPDVNVQQVAKSAVATKFRNNGQVCIAPQRFLVHTRIVEEFVDVALAEMKTLRVGNGMDTATTVGPLINARQRDRVEGLVNEARQEGAEILFGGQRPAHLTRGYFYEPTLITGLKEDSAVITQEIFGPVLPIIPFAEEAQALAVANSTEYGLASFVFTNDINTATRVYEQLEFGMVGVNEWLPHTTEAPFGGWKQSGLGHESGQEGLEDYLETKLVTLGSL